MLFQLLLLLDSTIRLATPLVLAAMAGLFCERSGVVDIALEGKMLGAAFAAAAVAQTTDSAWLGLLAGMPFGLRPGHGPRLRLDHPSRRPGGLGHGAQRHRGGPGADPGRRLVPPGGPRAGHRAGRPVRADRPAVRRGRRATIPILGPIYAELISGHNILVYVAALSVPLVAWVVYRTRFGLRLRAVGENPAAVDTAGISVEGMRYRALMVTGALCGIAGAYLSIAQSAGFIRDMTAGKGYLALAALIFGKWRPVPALLACLLFAFTDALQARLQGVPLPVHRRGAGAADPGAALSADHLPARRLRRQGGGAQGDRHPLRQGAVMRSRPRASLARMTHDPLRPARVAA